MIVGKYNFTSRKVVMLKFKFNVEDVKNVLSSVSGVRGVLGSGFRGSWFLPVPKGCGFLRSGPPGSSFLPVPKGCGFLRSGPPGSWVPGSFLFLSTQANGKCHITSHYLVHCVALNIRDSGNFVLYRLHTPLIAALPLCICLWCGSESRPAHRPIGPSARPSARARERFRGVDQFFYF
jgi:hypothetical protein